MSTDSVYFLPSSSFEVGKFKREVVKSLQEMFLIDGYLDKEKEHFASSDLLPFQYASVHDNNQHKLVPEASPEISGSTCYKCHEEIDDIFYDVINDYYDFEGDTGIERDMRDLELVCPKCKTKQTLVEVVLKQPDDSPVLFANQYFQFVDIQEPVEQKFIDNLKERLGCDLRLVYERM